VLKKGLEATEALWEPVRALYVHVYQVAHLLGNAQQQAAEHIEQQFASLLTQMSLLAQQSETGRAALLHFVKVSASYGPHLFFCYQVSGLPRTNNDLEQTFGKVRVQERRATGRRGAVPGLVVRGAVRIQAALATRQHSFSVEDLVPYDLPTWRDLRMQISSRLEARRKQFRFRKEPITYLAQLEDQLLKLSLRS
jgi:hypothetical protein